MEYMGASVVFLVPLHFYSHCVYAVAAARCVVGEYEFGVVNWVVFPCANDEREGNHGKKSANKRNQVIPNTCHIAAYSFCCLFVYILLCIRLLVCEIVYCIYVYQLRNCFKKTFVSLFCSIYAISIYQSLDKH